MSAVQAMHAVMGHRPMRSVSDPKKIGESAPAPPAHF